MEDYYVSTFFASAFITVGIYYFEELSSIALKYAMHSPGVGRIYMKKNPKTRYLANINPKNKIIGKLPQLSN